jgi:4-amino-4-deoxychorismate lyase
MFECLVNGEISTFVKTTNRGLNYADGLFETLSVRHGRSRRWQAHMDRLGAGCERLGLAMPPQAILLREVQTVSAGLPDAVVKIVLTRDAQSRGYMPPEIKVCNRMVSAHTYGAAEGILLDREEHVVSAVAANVFLVMGDRLITPGMDRCGVRGVIRGHILTAFAARCEQRRILLDMLLEADEVFICNSVRGIVPLIAIDGQEYKIGQVTRELQRWLLGASKT